VVHLSWAADGHAHAGVESRGSPSESPLRTRHRLATPAFAAAFAADLSPLWSFAGDVCADVAIAAPAQAHAAVAPAPAHVAAPSGASLAPTATDAQGAVFVPCVGQPTGPPTLVSSRGAHLSL
jgi:hypothetical protein